MDGTDEHTRHVLRWLLPLIALLLALAAPVVAEARAGGGHAPGRGSAPIRSNNSRIGVRQVTGGGIQPATPPPIPPPDPTAIPTIQQTRNNVPAPVGVGSPAASTANPETSTLGLTSANPRRTTSSSRTPPFIVSVVVLILAAGSAGTIVGFFAFCRYVRRREREQLRGLR